MAKPSVEAPSTDGNNPNDIRFRRHFLLAGLILGIAVSGGYLYLVHRQRVAAAPGVAVDSVGKQVFFVVLILFATIFQCSLLSKLFLWVKRQTGSRSRNR